MPPKKQQTSQDKNFLNNHSLPVFYADSLKASQRDDRMLLQFFAELPDENATVEQARVVVPIGLLRNVFQGLKDQLSIQPTQPEEDKS